MTPLRHALNEYRQTSVDAGIAYADPHTLITMLFEGLQARLAKAKGAMVHGETAVAGESLGRAMDIVLYLQACLDKSKGDELAENLDALYDYMVSRLFKANIERDPQALDEVSGLVHRIESAWRSIGTTVHRPAKPAPIALGA